MRATTAINKTFTCLLIAAAVLVSGTHAKDLATLSLPALWIDAKKAEDPQQHIVKVATESLHDHADKSVKVQASTSGDGQQADTRSLRLLHERKKQGPTQHITDRVRLWWSLNSLWLA
jgi:hypothetical protein